jgi:ABC-type branched-subunit amino acid transport system substrate-binding protein
MDDTKEGNPDPTQGAKNLTDLPHANSCPNPIAIVGPYNSGVAQSEISIAAKNHLLLLSPSNTAPCLTRPDYSTSDCSFEQIHPKGFSNTYACLPGTDIDRGYLSANFLVSASDSTNLEQSGLGAQRIEVVGAEDLAGTQVAQALIKTLRQKGITPAGVDCIKSIDDYNKDHSCLQLNPSVEAFSMDNIGALATKIQDEHADAVFFGGLNVEGAGLLLKDLRDLGLDQISFVGTGGSFVADAGAFFGRIGSHAAKTYSILAGTDPSTLTTKEAVTFSHQYQSVFKQPPEPLSAGGYDAANIVIQAIKGLIDAGKPVTKENVAQAVLSGRFVGVTSNDIHFDQNGDNIGQRAYTIYQSQQKSQNVWGWEVLTTREIG